MIEAGDLLTHYSFDLGGASVEQLLDRWLRRYPATWVRSAVIEALYQGRYKAVSVDQILRLWLRRGHPIYHFNHEFERIVCSHFPRQSTRLETFSDADEQASSLAGSDRLEIEGLPEEIATESPSSGTEPFVLEPLSPAETTAPPPETAAFSTSRHREGEIQLEDVAPFGLDLTDPFAASRGEAAKHPIDSFVPTADDESDFYTKLKAVAHGEETTEREGVATVTESPPRRASNPRSE